MSDRRPKTFQINEKIFHALKVRAIRKGKKLYEYIEEIFLDHLEKGGK